MGKTWSIWALSMFPAPDYFLVFSSPSLFTLESSFIQCGVLVSSLSSPSWTTLAYRIPTSQPRPNPRWSSSALPCLWSTPHSVESGWQDGQNMKYLNLVVVLNTWLLLDFLLSKLIYTWNGFILFNAAIDILGNMCWSACFCSSYSGCAMSTIRIHEPTTQPHP